MGRLVYEGEIRADFEDRLLAHLQIVIGNKLRRGESFYFSWKEDKSTGNGRTSIWVHPHAMLIFRFSGGRAPSINPAWLEGLNYTANSAAGLYAVPEPAQRTGSPEIE